MDQQEINDSANQPGSTEPQHLLHWLEDQQREDRRQLAELRKIVEAQQREFQHLTQRFEALEHQLTTTQASIPPYSALEEMVERIKGEVLGLVEAQRMQQQQAHATLTTRMDAQGPVLAHLAKALEAVQGALTALEQQAETVPARLEQQMEHLRNLAQGVEAFEKRFSETQARLLQINERLASQADASASLARQLEQLAGSLANTRAQLTRFSQIESALQETKSELIAMIQGMEAAWQKEIHAAVEIRDAAIKDLRVKLDLMARELEPIPQLQEQLQALPAEDQRLRKLLDEQSRQIQPLHEAIATLQERLSYVEEDRPKINQRFDELTAQLPPLQESIQENAGKIQFLEEWVQRSAQQIDEYKRLEDQMERWRAAFIEEIRQNEKRRDRRLTDWEKTLAEHAQLIEQWRETIKRFELAHYDNIRAVEAMQGLPEQLARDRDELAERQRLAEERIQRELEAWQEENEKRWRLFLKRYDYDREQQAKRDAEQDRRFEPLETWREEIVARIARELDRLDENDRRILARVVDIARYVEKAVEYQLQQQKKQRELLEEEIQLAEFDVLVTPPREEVVTRTMQRPKSKE